jgi:hypothetical protein
VKPLGVAAHGGKRAHRRFGGGVVGHAGAAEDLRHLARVAQRQERGQQRLVPARGGGRRHDRRGARQVGHELRGADQDDPVHVGILHHDAEGARETLRVGVPDHVDRVVDRGRPRKGLGEPALRRGVEAGELQAVADRRVGREDARPARVRHDRGAAAQRHGLVRKGARVLEQLVQPLDAQDPRLQEERVVRLVRSGERAGVGARGAGALGGAARLDRDDRLAFVPRDRARDLQEALGALQIFDVQEDHAGLGVVGEVLEEVAFVQVGLVAERGELGEAKALLGHDLQRRDSHRPALREERDAPRRRHPAREGGVHRDGGGGVDDAQAIGPHQTHSARARRPRDFRLPRRALGPDLLEPRRDDHGGRHAAAAARLDDPQHRVGGDDDDRQVDRIGDRLHGRVGADPQDAALARMDRIHDRAAPGREEVLEHRPPHAAGPRRRTDRRDRGRMEEGPQEHGPHYREGGSAALTQKCVRAAEPPFSHSQLRRV